VLRALLAVARSHEEVDAYLIIGAPGAEHGEVELVELTLGVAALARDGRVDEVDEPVGRVDGADPLDPVPSQLRLTDLQGEPANDDLGGGDRARGVRRARHEL